MVPTRTIVRLETQPSKARSGAKSTRRCFSGGGWGNFKNLADFSGTFGLYDVLKDGFDEKTDVCLRDHANSLSILNPLISTLL